MDLEIRRKVLAVDLRTELSTRQSCLSKGRSMRLIGFLGWRRFAGKEKVAGPARVELEKVNEGSFDSGSKSKDVMETNQELEKTDEGSYKSERRRKALNNSLDENELRT